MAAEKVTLKLVSGARYSVPSISDAVLVKGDKIEVTPAQAAILLADGWTDGSNNFHEYFEEVASEESSEVEGDEADAPEDDDNDTDAAAAAASAASAPAASKTVRAPRTTAKK